MKAPRSTSNMIFCLAAAQLTVCQASFCPDQEVPEKVLDLSVQNLPDKKPSPIPQVPGFFEVEKVTIFDPKEKFIYKGKWKPSKNHDGFGRPPKKIGATKATRVKPSRSVTSRRVG